jgi:hypothetical protein
MSHGQFHISTQNPNDVTGGGGCICSPEKQTDCRGPYAVFYANELESIASPHVVVGLPCLKAALRAAEDGEALSAGERSYVADPEVREELGLEDEPEL